LIESVCSEIIIDFWTVIVVDNLFIILAIFVGFIKITHNIIHEWKLLIVLRIHSLTCGQKQAIMKIAVWEEKFISIIVVVIFGIFRFIPVEKCNPRIDKFLGIRFWI